MAISPEAIRRLTIIATDRGLTEVNTKLREHERVTNQVAAAQTRMAASTATVDARLHSLLRQRDRLAMAYGTGGAAGAAGYAGWGVAGAVAPYAAAAAGVIGTIAAMNAVYERGAQLLEKYGNAQRRFDRTDLESNMKSLTRFQDDTVSAAQAKYAGELGMRLGDANWQIEKFLKTSLDITDPALKLQAAWVGTVEGIARATSYADVLIDKLSKVPSGVWNMGLNAIPGVGPMLSFGRSAINYLAGPAPVAPTAEESLRAAYGNLGAAMGLANIDKKGAPIGNTFAARFGAMNYDLANQGKEQEKAARSTRDAWDRALESVGKSIALQEASLRSIGLGVEAQARYRTEALLTEAAERAGVKIIGERAEAYERLADRAGKAALALAKAQIGNEIAFDKKALELGIDGNELQIAQRLRQIYPDINDALASKEAYDLRAIANMRELKSATDEFGQTLLSGLLQGQDAMQSLERAASGYIEKLAAANLKRFMDGGSLFGNGNLMSGQGAVGMLSAGLAGYQSGNWATGALGGAMAGASFGPVGMAVGGIAGLVGGLFGGKSQKKAAEQARLQAQAEQRAREEQERLAAEDRAYDYSTRLMATGWDTGTLSGALAQFDRQAEAERRAEQRAGGQAMVELEATLAAERLKLMDDFAQKALERQRSYDDRLFAAQNDASTLAGALAAFDRKAQQEREQEIKLGGGAMVSLEAALAAERLNIVQDFNQRAIEEQQRAADKMIGIAKGIRDYLDGLRLGSLSTLSPAEQLAAARSTYERQLGLAQSGDMDALGSITQYANPFLEQLRSFYGPSQRYGELFSAITSELEALASRADLAGGMGGIPNSAWSSGVNDNTPALADLNLGAQTAASSNSVASAQSSQSIAQLVSEVQSLRAENKQIATALAKYLSDGNEKTQEVVDEISGLRTDTRQVREERRIRDRSAA